MELDLQEIRQDLDQIDDQMAALLEQRMKTVARVAAYKKEKGQPVLDAAREEQIIARLSEQVEKDFVPCLEMVYKKLFEASRAYQKRLLGEEK